MLWLLGASLGEAGRTQGVCLQNLGDKIEVLGSYCYYGKETPARHDLNHWIQVGRSDAKSSFLPAYQNLPFISLLLQAFVTYSLVEHRLASTSLGLALQGYHHIQPSTICMRFAINYTLDF